MIDIVGKEIHIKSFHLSGYNEIFITINPEKRVDFAELLKISEKILSRENAIIIRQYIYYEQGLYEETLDQIEKLFGKLSWPALWINNSGLSKIPTACFIHAIAGKSCKKIYQENRLSGHQFEDPSGNYLYLTNILSKAVFDPEREQAEECLHRVMDCLDITKFKSEHILKCWCIIDNTLSWSHEFDDIYTKIINPSPLHEALAKITARNPAQAALSVSLLACIPGTSDYKLIPFRDSLHLIQSAPDYSKLYSGTLSTNLPKLDEPDYQMIATSIKRLLNDLDALLKKQQFEWKDIVRGSVHLNHVPEKMEFLRQIRKFDDIEYPLNFTFDPQGRMKRDLELEVDAIRLK